MLHCRLLGAGGAAKGSLRAGIGAQNTGTVGAAEAASRPVAVAAGTLPAPSVRPHWLTDPSSFRTGPSEQTRVSHYSPDTCCVTSRTSCLDSQQSRCVSSTVSEHER
jgi:hypothetical protein